MKSSEPDKNCKLCERLYSFRKNNRIRFPDWFNKPVPSFGSQESNILIVGLAPGLQGANKTGRPFTGDYAGKILYETLLKNNLASGFFDEEGKDNLKLHNCRITNAVKCVPPQNKPLGSEINNCNNFLIKEIKMLKNLKIIISLGRVAHLGILKVFKLQNSKYTFAHGKIHKIDNIVLINSYHCSKYNIFTKRLTVKNFNKVFKNINSYL